MCVRENLQHSSVLFDDFFMPLTISPSWFWNPQVSEQFVSEHGRGFNISTSNGVYFKEVAVNHFKLTIKVIFQLLQKKEKIKMLPREKKHYLKHKNRIKFHEYI